MRYLLSCSTVWSWTADDLPFRFCALDHFGCAEGPATALFCFHNRASVPFLPSSCKPVGAVSAFFSPLRLASPLSLFVILRTAGRVRCYRYLLRYNESNIFSGERIAHPLWIVAISSLQSWSYHLWIETLPKIPVTGL